MTSLVLAMLVTYAPTRDVGTMLDPEREARVQRLGKELRCAVCQGVAISDSPAPMAQAQLDKVRELVAEGKSDEEILTYFVARYGEWVLLRPTTNGINVVLWAAPVVLLALGLLVIMGQAKKKVVVVPKPADAAAPADDTAKPEDPFLAQVRADLEK